MNDITDNEANENETENESGAPRPTDRRPLGSWLRVVGVCLATCQFELDRLLHQARRAGLIDAHGVGDLAHRERVGCRGQRLEQPQARGSADAAGAAPGRSPECGRSAEARHDSTTTPRTATSAAAGEAPDVVAVPVVRRVVAVIGVAAVAVGPVGAGVAVGVRPSAVRSGTFGPRRARHPPTAQPGESGRDGVGRVVGSGRHASNLHVT